MNVHVLQYAGHRIVTESFRNAMRHAAIHIIPDDEARAEARLLARFPRLSAVGAGGSFNQWLRYLNQRGFGEVFIIEEHGVGRPPGKGSLVSSVDLLKSIDPSFEVQRALWNLAEDGGSVNALAGGIEACILADIEDKRMAGIEDSEIVAAYRTLEQRMGGIEVLPKVGRATSILEKLPRVSADAFIAVTDEL